MTEEEFQVYRETTGRQAGNRPCVGRDLRGGAVACVTWREAEDYVSWLSDRTGASYRLPTEAEWEYVARRARAVGVFGMVGRVWEWVDDCWHEDYRGAPSVGTPWFAEEGGDCGFRGLRGGSWLDVGVEPANLRTAKRLFVDAGAWQHNVGFRVARSLGRNSRR